MPVKIINITIATTNIEKMATFYNATLDCDFQSIELFPGTTGYRGTLAGINCLMCPNSVAGVEAKQNRQQFDFSVDDIQATMSAALANGGTELQAVTKTETLITASVYDPDGNSIVFIQHKT